jgi:hypothetical protein
LIGHIKHGFPALYRLYILLKGRDEPATLDEIAIAPGQKVLDPAKATAYFDELEKASTTIIDLFHRQAEQTKVCSLLVIIFCVLTYFSSFTQGKEFDPKKFDQYLHEWIVAADRPFDTTEIPEFRRLLEYTHLCAGLQIPSASTVKRRIMTMGEDTIQGIKDMIAVCSPLTAYPIFLLIKCHNVRSLAAMSACHSMPGHQVTDTHF